METNRIAALTMLRGDEFFLRRWIAWYGFQLGRENLYVFFDGKDQKIPDFCEGINVTLVERLEGNVHRGDRRRADFLSVEAGKLFAAGYNFVIGTDVDEFLIPDPDTGMSLSQFLSEKSSKRRVCVSALGIDVGQDTRCEGPLDESVPFLGQRRHALLSTRYSKTSVLTKPVSWGSGFHRVRGHRYHIERDLYLFHFGCVDLGRMERKFSDRERLEEGWERHFRKRIRTITAISSCKASDWEASVKRARRIQNNIHSLYSRFKPAMLNIKIVVDIPEKFFGLV